MLDLRGAEASSGAGLDRQRRGRSADGLLDAEVGEALDDHLASRPASVDYTAELVRRFESFAPEWADRLSYIPSVAGDTVSWDELNRRDEFDMVMIGTRRISGKIDHAEVEAASTLAADLGAELCLTIRGVRLLSYDRRASLVRRWSIARATQVSRDGAIVTFVKREHEATRQIDEVSVADFGADSTFVRLEIFNDMQVLNSTHPFIEAVNAITDEHSSSRDRLLAAVAKSRYREPSILQLTQAIAESLADRTLLAYAEFMASQNEFTNTYSSGTALHLPLIPNALSV